MRHYGLVSYERNLYTNSYEKIRKVASISSSAKYRVFDNETQALGYIQSRNYGRQRDFGNKAVIYPNKFPLFIGIDIRPNVILIDTSNMFDLQIELKDYQKIGKSRYAKELSEQSTSTQLVALNELMRELHIYPLSLVTTNVLVVSVLRDRTLKYQHCKDIHKTIEENKVEFSLTLEFKE